MEVTLIRRTPGAQLYRIERRHARLTEEEREALRDKDSCPLDDDELRHLAERLRQLQPGRRD